MHIRVTHIDRLSQHRKHMRGQQRSVFLSRVNAVRLHLVQTADELNADFALPGVLEFDEPLRGMPRARITSRTCQAELFLQGAHLTQWQPGDLCPGLFLSECSAFELGKAIRGGVPVIFPWFGSPSTSPVPVSSGAPSHGFARIWPWTLRFAALAGDAVHLSLTLDQTDGLRALGFSGFELAYEVILGSELTVRLTVANTGEAPFFFEEALHSYLAVSDSREVTVAGLGDTEFLDKTDNFARKKQTDPLLKFEGEVDRPYLNTEAPLKLHDPILDRNLLLTKIGSRTTVTWNPGPALAAKLPDLSPDAWRQFVCLETANVAENAITLQPRQAHTMEMNLKVDRKNSW